MNAAMLMLVASTIAAPQPATNDLSASPSLSMGHSVTFVTDEPDVFQGTKPATPAGKPSPTHQAAGKSVTIMAQGGILFCCSYTGFAIGVGAAFTPMQTHDQFEINADFNFHRIASANGWDISFNGAYLFHLNNSKVKPFAGGGLVISHLNYNTNAAFQILGGVQTALASGRDLRFQIRFGFFSSTVTLLLIGIAF